MKKLISLILVLAMMFTAIVPTYAAWSPEETQAILEIQETLETINKSVDKIATGSKDAISAIETAFSVASKMGTVLCVVNGSVTFLRLIGVMEDPTEKALAQIQEQLDTIDDKLTNMSQTLNNIAGDITKLIASEEFHARGQKAMTLQQNWSDFAYRYMEHSLDDLMTDFEVLVADGMKKWCKSIPSEDIVINYVDGANGLEAIYGATNAENAEATLTISKDCFPSEITWNINTYLDSIQGFVEAAFAESAENFTVDDFGGIGLEVNEETIEQIAVDAANQVVYNVTVDVVNEDTNFVYDVRDAFENYCNHLLSANDGIDAMLNSMYLTHAFQYQIKDDINEFFDQMIVKTGTYGMFASDILGMSDSVYDSNKISAIETMCDTVNALEYAREHSIVGTKKESKDSKYDNYCYITNNLVYYTDAELRSDLTAKTTEWSGAFGIDYARYESVDTSPIEFRYLNGGVPSNSSLIGDTDALMIFYTLESNGITGNYHNYFKSNICPQSCSDHGEIVTSYEKMATVPNDGVIKYALMRVIGNWFPKSLKVVTLNNLPGDTESKYIREKQGIQGSVINTATGELSANVPLLTVAIYAEGHSKWTVDEIGFLTGPYYEGYQEYYYNPKSRSGEDCTYTCSAWNSFNVLATAPVEIEPENDYAPYPNPLESYLDIFYEIKDEYAEEERRLVTAPLIIAPLGFRDVVKGAWYEESVNYCIDHELMEGLSRVAFGPQQTTTRAQVAQMLYRLEGEPAFMNDNVFSDVPSGAWYEKAVVWANGKGIVNGFEDGTFRPNEFITREQFATMIYNYVKAGGGGFVGDWYFFLDAPDAKNIHSWADEAMHWCVMKGILTGYEDDSLKPAGLLTRAEVATMFARFYKLNKGVN